MNIFKLMNIINMQQLKVEHENTTAKKDRRWGKGRVIALSRRIYRLLQTDVFYVESESTENVYYFVKFKSDLIEWCSCPDNSLRGSQKKCKHIHAIEFAIRLGTLKDTDRLPTEAKVRKVAVSATVVPTPKSYTEDDYSF
jgi:predicted nucleic acid-binding Zn finger protein